MNWHGIFTVYRKEMKDSLRDRRTLISMIVVPTLIMPLIMMIVGVITSTVVKKARQEASPIVILGGADSPGVVQALKSDPKLRVVTTTTDYRRLVADKMVRVAVEIPAGFEAALAKGEPATVTLYHYEGEIKSGFGLGQLETFFRHLRDRTIEARLAGKGLPVSLVKPFEVKRQNVAPPEKVGGNLVGGIIPYIIILLCFTGAMYPAMDLTAGEKERGTMETLLCSPVGRTTIVLGKFLTVLTASLATMLLSILSMTVSFIIGGSLLFGRGAAAMQQAAMKAGPGGVIPIIDPVGALGVAAMVLPVAVLFAAVIFTIALFAKSYKEAQSYVSPLIIVIILPAMMGMLPGVELNARLALVPILNLSLVCKEMLSGVWHWSYIGLIFASTAVYAAGALAVAVAMFKRESVLFRA
jgi:sodium transport system permease protein